MPVFFFCAKIKIIMEISELRHDPISNDWIVVARSRRQRPEFFTSSKERQTKARCPFCDLKNLREKSTYESKNLIAIPNLYPAFSFNQTFKKGEKGPFPVESGIGVHEIVILKNHRKQIFEYRPEEIKEIFFYFSKRIKELKANKKIKYVSIFMNWREEAGASIAHPHLQLMAIPKLDEGYLKILKGSKEYFKKYKKCFFCQMIKWEKKEKKRIVYENKHFIAITPFVSRTNFEIRIYPKKHSPYFEGENNFLALADVLKIVLKKLNRGLANPAYNLILTNSPSEDKSDFFHWSISILPRTTLKAGFELSTHMEILTIFPREAAEYLRKF